MYSLTKRDPADDGGKAPPRGRLMEPNMDMTTILIIVLVIVLLGGGGWYGRGRWY
jgi:hypothetical protein